MRLVTSSLLTLVLFVTPAVAEKTPVDNGITYEPQQVGSCEPFDTVMGAAGGFPPDDDPAGILFGPATTSDPTRCITNAWANVILQHTWIGDIIMRLGYDRDCDGVVDTGEVSLMCRPGRDCDPGASGFGCGGDAPFILVDFADSATGDLGQVGCDATYASGCYGIADESAFDFSVFDGEVLGGCFWLFMSDNAAGDTGGIKQFSVFLETELCAVPIEESSWSELKLEFGSE